MLGKLKKITSFGKFDKELLGVASMHNELKSGLLKSLDNAFEERKQDTVNSNYTVEDVDAIIKHYANKNMILASGVSLVPGPAGILGAVPELMLNFYNQMSMVYDLSCANNKEDFINKDILLDVLLASFGGNTQLASLQNTKALLSEPPQTVLVEKAQALGQQLIQRTMKKSVVQFIPVAGPILMGTWSKMATAKTSKTAIQFLSDDLIYVEHTTPEENTETKRLLQIEKIKGLINLIEANDDINEHQIDLIRTIIENADLDDTQKAYYIAEALKTGSMLPLDKELLQTYEEADDLVMEMVVMAKRSGQVDALEKAYILEVAQLLDIEQAFVEDLFYTSLG